MMYTETVFSRNRRTVDSKWSWHLKIRTRAKVLGQSRGAQALPMAFPERSV